MKIEITNKEQERRLVVVKTTYATKKESYTQVEPGDTVEVEVGVAESSIRLEEIAME